MYWNVTGPGDYNVPGFANQYNGEVESQRRTYPSYSMGPNTKQPYWPTYAVDFKGQDSPGMTTYHPKKSTVTEQNPIFSVGRASRFTGIEERNRDMLKNV